MNNTHATIMVVDDQLDFLETVKLILEVEGYQVWTASNGQQALDRLEKIQNNKNLPDLILADIMMPILDGYKLYEQLQFKVKFENIPFIFLTAKTAAADLQYGKMLGVEDYLTKPCSAEVLLASIQDQLANRNIGPEAALNENSQKTKFSPKGILIFLGGLVIVIILMFMFNIFEIPFG